MMNRSEAMGDKVHSREGNNPDQQLRSQKYVKWKRRFRYVNSQEVGLEAAIPLKSA